MTPYAKWEAHSVAGNEEIWGFRSAATGDELMPGGTPVDLRTDVPHSARMYDYYMGGKTNYPADRAAAEQVLAAFPTAGLAARQNRAFLVRAACFLAAEAGIRNFLDIGTGIPTSPNLHEIVQEITPGARVAYVDNDPIVITHGRALLSGSMEGRTTFVNADLRDLSSILRSLDLTETIDLDRPVGLSLVAVLHFLRDEDHPADTVSRLVRQLAPGSHLVMSHATADFVTPDTATSGTDAYGAKGIPLRLRSLDEVRALVPPYMEILEPGIVPVHHWRPDLDTESASDSDVSVYGLIARVLP